MSDPLTQEERKHVNDERKRIAHGNHKGSTAFRTINIIDRLCGRIEKLEAVRKAAAEVIEAEGGGHSHYTDELCERCRLVAVMKESLK